MIFVRILLGKFLLRRNFVRLKKKVKEGRKKKKKKRMIPGKDDKPQPALNDSFCIQDERGE